IYVRRAPAVTVGDFAEVLQRLFRGSQHLDVDTVGARPGDKVHEVLVSADEMRRGTSREEWIVIPPVVPTDSAEEATGSLLDPPPFSSDRAPRLSVDDLEILAREWCVANGVDL
ncbi:MAG: polysaccharide biosynthesis protein, partial [Acidimicrobiia bacterium]